MPSHHSRALFLLTLCTWIFVSYAQDVQSRIQMRAGGHWDNNNITYHIYDIITTNKGDKPMTNIVLTIKNSSFIFQQWNLKPTKGNVADYTLVDSSRNHIITVGPNKEIYVAGFVTEGGGAPAVAKTQGSFTKEGPKKENSCKKFGLSVELLPGNSSWVDGELNTIYYVHFLNSGTSMITHAVIDITASSGTVVDEESFFGLHMTDDYNGYNVSFSGHLYPGDSLPQSAGFTLVGVGGALLTCESATILTEAKVNKDSRIIAGMLIGGVVALCLLIATVVVVVMYTRKMRKKRVTYNLSNFAKDDYKYQKLIST